MPAVTQLSLYDYRLKMKFSCMMDLKKYPLDVQVCTMEVASCERHITLYLLLQYIVTKKIKKQQFIAKNLLNAVPFFGICTGKHG